VQNGRVKVIRFDPDVAMSLRNSRTSAKFGQLIGGASLTEAGVVFLEEGAQWTSSGPDSHQLLAITTGSCTVEAEGLSPFVLGALQAIVAEPREIWSVCAMEPVIALLLEGSFDVWALVVTQEIAVVDYDEEWPHSFERIRQELGPFVDDVALRIDHVGSTSVPELAAKPIIDVDIVVSNEFDVPKAIERLRSAGYRWRGDLGVEGREAFSPTSKSDLPAHHLYVVVENNRAHLDHLLLRDALREDPQMREEYATLKKSNVDAANGNMDIYVAAKADFVARQLTRARELRGLAPVVYWKPN
jgi:GrpB-like predicted nucleotidyltransferase (UPF0157 family)